MRNKENYKKNFCNLKCLKNLENKIKLIVKAAKINIITKQLMNTVFQNWLNLKIMISRIKCLLLTISMIKKQIKTLRKKYKRIKNMCK